jgi:hypothetical protein
VPETARPATGVCIATRIVKARLVVRHTTPGHPTAWPMLVISKCPWTPWDRAGHAHIHFMTEPGPWYRVAPCNRRPYLITLATA